MNSKDKGDISLSNLITRFLELGNPVSIPFGDNQPYDLVVEIQGVLKRIQVKTGRLDRKGTVLVFNACSGYAQKGCRPPGYLGKADLFGVYSYQLKKCYLVPVDTCGVRDCTLRLVETNQKKRIRMAVDFEL